MTRSGYYICNGKPICCGISHVKVSFQNPFSAWTDPIVPAYAEPPAVHPNEGLKEGDSMTILCIAMGTPTPTVTLYLGMKIFLNLELP